MALGAPLPSGVRLAESMASASFSGPAALSSAAGALLPGSARVKHGMPDRDFMNEVVGVGTQAKVRETTPRLMRSSFTSGPGLPVNAMTFGMPAVISASPSRQSVAAIRSACATAAGMFHMRGGLLPMSRASPEAGSSPTIPTVPPSASRMGRVSMPVRASLPVASSMPSFVRFL